MVLDVTAKGLLEQMIEAEINSIFRLMQSVKDIKNHLHIKEESDFV